MNALMYIPFTLQVAHGWTSLSFIINAAWSVIMLPGIFLSYRVLGAPGVAMLWLVLNLIQLLLMIQIMHRRIHSELKGEWYFYSVFIPAAISIAAGALSLVGRGSPILSIITAVVVSLLAMGAATMLLPQLREKVLFYGRQIFMKAQS